MIDGYESADGKALSAVPHPRPSDDRSNNHPALTASPICLGTLLAPADMADANSLAVLRERRERKMRGKRGGDARRNRTDSRFVRYAHMRATKCKKRSHGIKDINIVRETPSM